MCPLRFILIFLSATLAGFLVLRNLGWQPDHITDTELEDANNEDDHTTLTSDAASPSLNNATSMGALLSGFWNLLDMASGRYLWKQLVSSSSPKPE
ncbi:hypothetical protein JHK87_040654 [Glycine soja]|nr:hypothetical protein JHK87_040654 [Glycine soja]